MVLSGPPVFRSGVAGMNSRHAITPGFGFLQSSGQGEEDIILAEAAYELNAYGGGLLETCREAVKSPAGPSR